MAFTLTREQIIALAPDAASAKSAQGLLSESKWPTLGGDVDALWGECQGSGSKPYQVQVELPGLASRCSCPSRKFPCKHALALLLLKAAAVARLAQGDKPEWVHAWLNARRERSDKKTASAGSAKAPADLEQQEAAAEKREAQRWSRIEKGLMDLERWMADQFRRGLAKFGAEQKRDWQAMAARMIDAQAPSLGPRLQAALALLQAGPEQLPRAIEQFGLLQLLVDAVRRRGSLSPASLADLRAALGWAPDKDTVLRHGEMVEDTWRVLGQQVLELEGRLFERRVWWLGQQSGRFVLLQDFSYGNRHFEGAYVTGADYRAEVCFYPGAVPIRALVKTAVRVDSDRALVWQDADTALAEAGGRFAGNPWQLQVPLLIAGGTLNADVSQPALLVSTHALPLRLSAEAFWSLHAFAGGQALTWFGEWDGNTLSLLNAVSASGESWVLGVMTDA